MVFFSGHPDKQPEFAECCFDSCAALLIQRSGSIQEVSATAAELPRLHLQKLKRRFFKKEKKNLPHAVFICLFRASLVMFTLHLAFATLVKLCVSMPSFVFTLSPLALGFSHLPGDIFEFCVCACGNFPVLKCSGGSSPRKPFFSSSFRRRFEDVLFWFVPSAADPELRLISLLL